MDQHPPHVPRAVKPPPLMHLPIFPSSHLKNSVHKNIGNDNHVINITSDKHSGLADTDQRGTEMTATVGTELEASSAFAIHGTYFLP
jgi:hypothetical protein